MQNFGVFTVQILKTTYLKNPQDYSVVLKMNLFRVKWSVIQILLCTFQDSRVTWHADDLNLLCFILAHQW